MPLRGDMAGLSSLECSPTQLASVRELVGNMQIAETVCSRYNVSGEGGAQSAVLKYLAQSSGPSALETNNSVNTLFLLFSGYLVFLMQAGFAMVS